MKKYKHEYKHCKFDGELNEMSVTVGYVVMVSTVCMCVFLETAPCCDDD